MELCTSGKRKDGRSDEKYVNRSKIILYEFLWTGNCRQLLFPVFLHKINSVEVKLRLTLYCMSIKYKESGDVQ